MRAVCQPTRAVELPGSQSALPNRLCTGWQARPSYRRWHPAVFTILAIHPMDKSGHTNFVAPLLPPAARCAGPTAGVCPPAGWRRWWAVSCSGAAAARRAARVPWYVPAGMADLGSTGRHSTAVEQVEQGEWLHPACPCKLFPNLNRFSGRGLHALERRRAVTLPRRFSCTGCVAAGCGQRLTLLLLLQAGCCGAPSAPVQMTGWWTAAGRHGVHQ